MKEVQIKFLDSTDSPLNLTQKTIGKTLYDYYRRDQVREKVIQIFRITDVQWQESESTEVNRQLVMFIHVW